MLEDTQELVSVDDHLVEHPDVWLSRLPRRYQEAAPHVIEASEDESLVYLGAVVQVKRGSHVWVYEDHVLPNIAAIATMETRADAEFEAVRFDEMRPGAYDPVARLGDMDRDGVSVQLPFPSFPGFAGTKFLDSADKELALLCVKAYNDYVLDEWCAAAPDRYIPVILLPLWSPELCVQEIERCAPRGARAISFPDNPAGPLGLPSFFTDHWDDVFRAATAAEMPLCMHFGASRIVPQASKDASVPVQTALFGITLYNSMCEIIFSSLLDHHPDLKIVYSEGGIGWLPYALQRIDQVWEKYRHYTFIEPPLDPERPPSAVARSHVWGCFIDDPVGVRMRDEIGVDRLLWESDYPHVDSLWPNSRKNAEAVFADVPNEDVAKIVSKNARALFRF